MSPKAARKHAVLSIIQTETDVLVSWQEKKNSVFAFLVAKRRSTQLYGTKICFCLFGVKLRSFQRY